MKSKPLAVIISDVHYSLQNLSVADAAMRLAIAKANSLNVPLIVAGDLHDTKANMRAECISAMIETFCLCQKQPLVLRGNHDSVHEKSTDHALDFLHSYASIIDTSMYLTNPNLHFIPYHHDPEQLKAYLRTLPHNEILIMHQGISGSNSGEYIQDKSAITINDVAGFRVISGHYHTRQTIELPDGGVWDYVGNPYSLNFAEANDPPKGFQILYSDGSLEFVPTNLRKHMIIEVSMDNGHVYYPAKAIKQDDLVWVKVKGTNLHTVTRTNLRHSLEGLSLPSDFRLDLIPDDVHYSLQSGHDDKSQEQALDDLIDSVTLPHDCKDRIKKMWKDLV